MSGVRFETEYEAVLFTLRRHPIVFAAARISRFSLGLYV
jgi:hypothetical protein